MESSRNTREGDSNDNPRGQYPIPSRRRSIDIGKRRESFGKRTRNNRKVAQVGRELSLADRYQESRGTTVSLLFEAKPV